jgi:hypothetical protein
MYFEEASDAVWEARNSAAAYPEEAGSERIERRLRMRSAFMSLQRATEWFLEASVASAGTVSLAEGVISSADLVQGTSDGSS